MISYILRTLKQQLKPNEYSTLTNWIQEVQQKKSPQQTVNIDTVDDTQVDQLLRELEKQSSSAYNLRVLIKAKEARNRIHSSLLVRNAADYRPVKATPTKNQLPIVTSKSQEQEPDNLKNFFLELYA